MEDTTQHPNQGGYHLPDQQGFVTHPVGEGPAYGRAPGNNHAAQPTGLNDTFRATQAVPPAARSHRRPDRDGDAEMDGADYPDEDDFGLHDEPAGRGKAPRIGDPPVLKSNAHNDECLNWISSVRAWISLNEKWIVKRRLSDHAPH